MSKTSNGTYYYNVPSGVTPADHNIEYSHSVPVTDPKIGRYNSGLAVLVIHNPKSLSEYLEDITGHYIEGVDSWHTAHEYLIDLVQAMMVELVNRDLGVSRPQSYMSIIDEYYADGASITYCVGYDAKDGSVRLVVKASDSISDKVMTREGLDQMLSISADDLRG